MSQHSDAILNISTNRKDLGTTGEQLVIAHLKKNGFLILDQNYRKRFGEIDIIARKKNILTFIEVKLRKNQYFPLSQVITQAKQRKIIHTAKSFILKNKIHNVIYRFDVALITYNDGKHPNLTYIENAFTDTIY